MKVARVPGKIRRSYKHPTIDPGTALDLSTGIYWARIGHERPGKRKDPRIHRDLSVVDTGIEPVTPSISRKCATAAPIDRLPETRARTILDRNVDNRTSLFL